jgi:hypothetical protein
VFHAELAARELGSLSLVDSLRLTIAYPDHEPAKYGRAAARWLSRFIADAGLDMLGAQMALSALTLLQTPERPRSSRLLVELGRRHGVDLRAAA